MTKSICYRSVAYFSLALTSVGLLFATQPGRATPPDKSARTNKSKINAPRVSAPAVLRLIYPFKSGETRQYEVTALFNGHIPPFSQPGSQPLHLLAKIRYLAKVVKQDAQGTQVEFTVDTADASLLTKEIPLGTQINPNDEVDLGIQLPDVQKALTTTVILHPDGSIANVVNEGPNIIHINIGFDLRKLFQLTMPVIFPNTPIHPGDTWTSSSGVLGSNPGSTHYLDKLQSVAGVGKRLMLQIGQTATTKISDTLDKDGNSTSKPDDIISKLTGDVKVDGALKFQTEDAAVVGEKSGANLRGARMTTGLFKMQVALVRTVTKNDLPPDIKAANEGPIDFTAQILVEAQKSKDEGGRNNKQG